MSALLSVMNIPHALHLTMRADLARRAEAFLAEEGAEGVRNHLTTLNTR